MTVTDAPPLIQAIAIRDLFGRRSYDIKVPVVDGRPSRLLLLHGDNGSGKTTLLRLVWHTLSAADDKGHRTFLAKTPFSRLRIDMSGGRAIEVVKKDGLVGGFSITLSGVDGIKRVFNYVANDELKVRSPSQVSRTFVSEDFIFFDQGRTSVRRTRPKGRSVVLRQNSELEAEVQAEISYFKFLKSEVKTPLYLADDRSLYSDDPDVIRMREMLGRRDDKALADRLARLTFNELQITIKRVNEYLSGLMIGGQNDGSANSNAIYMNVLRELVEGESRSVDGVGVRVNDLLEEVAIASPKFERYGLVPAIDTTELKRLLNLAAGDRAELADRIASPFLSSLRARYDALSGAQQLLDSLIPAVNIFLNEKELTFTPRGGLRIVTFDGDILDVEALSSGERQLLMLLCTTLLAGVDANLFIIDEPELSLGVDWQRKILDSLLSVTERSSLQFMVATHSIEIISGHPESLVQLKPL